MVQLDLVLENISNEVRRLSGGAGTVWIDLVSLKYCLLHFMEDRKYLRFFCILHGVDGKSLTNLVGVLSLYGMKVN